MKIGDEIILINDRTIRLIFGFGHKSTPKIGDKGIIKRHTIVGLWGIKFKNCRVIYLPEQEIKNIGLKEHIQNAIKNR